MAWALASTLALTGAIHSDAAIIPESGPGFTLKVSLVDFMMIQRGLMSLPDDHAREALDKIRAQIAAQVK